MILFIRYAWFSPEIIQKGVGNEGNAIVPNNIVMDELRSMAEKKDWKILLHNACLYAWFQFV